MVEQLMKEKETSYLTVLGFVIRAQREATGLTRQQFAEITGYSESWLKKIESGFVAISIDRLRKVATCQQTNVCSLIEQADKLKMELESQGIRVRESAVDRESDILYQSLTSNTKGMTGAIATGNIGAVAACMSPSNGVLLAVATTLGRLLGNLK
ncbi:TPA: helix-turn-helix transcriptional regulator [Vibrio parahaemolyticus]|nr:helix-turn-helix transcriptional regulator [Vibrio parahaemolyticus]